MARAAKDIENGGRGRRERVLPIRQLGTRLETQKTEEGRVSCGGGRCGCCGCVRMTLAADVPAQEAIAHRHESQHGKALLWQEDCCHSRVDWRV